MEPEAASKAASVETAIDHTAQDDQLQLVTFEVAEEEFAVDILAVREINRMLQITRVPQSPADVEGVINLRGRIIPVVDLRKRFSLESGERDDDARIVVVEVSDRVVGFIVDRVHEVLRINSSIVEPAPAMTAGTEADYIQGVGKLDDRLLILIDLERLFTSGELKQMDQVVDDAAGQ
jgi:purine-binding chemotaxis protein CheW